MSEIAKLQCWEFEFAYAPANETSKEVHGKFKLKEHIVVSKTADGKPVMIYSYDEFGMCLSLESTQIINLPEVKRVLQSESESEGSTEYSNTLYASEARFPMTGIKVTIVGNTLKAKVESRFGFGTEAFKPAVELTLRTDRKKADKSIHKTYDGGLENSDRERLHVWARVSSEMPVPN